MAFESSVGGGSRFFGQLHIDCAVKNSSQEQLTRGSAWIDG